MCSLTMLYAKKNFSSIKSSIRKGMIKKTRKKIGTRNARFSQWIFIRLCKFIHVKKK